MLHKRPVMERVGEPAADWGFDTRGVVRDAVSMIETWAAREPTVTVLIGHVLSAAADDEMASDFALMYTGKWHRWPRSFHDERSLALWILAGAADDGGADPIAGR